MFKSSKKNVILIIVVFILMGTILTNKDKNEENKADIEVNNSVKVADASNDASENTPKSNTITPKEKTGNNEEKIETQSMTKDDNVIVYNGITYKIIKVDGGDLSGKREPNVAVNIGFGDREYWALTNEYGQLVYVLADKIILQDDSTEPVNASGRYYNDEAKVPGVERDDLDEGHVIADSLGGVSNAYNITPQDSTLNRHGDQAYMEKVIRDAGGCEKFVATITYQDTTTQIPSKYKYEYILLGNKIVDEFDNVNPDKVNDTIYAETEKEEIEETEDVLGSEVNEKEELKKIDKNGNGKVTIAEAKAAGYKMPIYSDFWLYKYMDDRDGDGMVGE